MVIRPLDVLYSDLRCGYFKRVAKFIISPKFIQTANETKIFRFNQQGGGKITLQDQPFGIEIEFTGVTRRKAAEIVAAHFNTTADHYGGSYDSYFIYDRDNRKWKIVSDSSIRCQRKTDGEVEEASNLCAVELVSPICKYDDITTIQELVRELRSHNAFANSSCGVHVHVDGSKQTPTSLCNLMKIIYSKNDLLYKSLNIEPDRITYCKALDAHLIELINKRRPQTMRQVEEIWYDGYDGNRDSHYHYSRYHFLNLHSLFHGNGSIELRGFNSTLAHAGKIKAYIQLSLAICNQAMVQKRASPKITTSTNEKYTFRTYLLRLGLIGNEFKTARKVLLANLDGNIAWKNPEDAQRQKQRLQEGRAREQHTENELLNAPEAEHDEQSHGFGMQMF
jgi:hypothetical protein